MLKRKNESQSSMVNHNWPPAILRHRPLETDFVRDGFAVLESFVNKVELKKIVPLVETVVTSSHELACTRPHNTLAPLRWNDPIVGLLLKSDRRVQALTDVLRADDLKWISGYVRDRKSTRLNSSHVRISYAVFCLKKKICVWSG